MVAKNIQTTLLDDVLVANEKGLPLSIEGAGSKRFYGRAITGQPLSILDHSGIIDYDPTELVITARTGTTLLEINEVLNQQHQMLGFEPDDFSGRATLGGTLAAAISGPAAPYNGGARDFVLGMKILTGHGQVMNFGGRVIKNVAGFDISRLMVGALGCLGILLEASLKIIPRPESQHTLIFEHLKPDQAISFMNQIAGKPHPLSAASWFDGQTTIRLSGSEAGVRSTIKTLGGDSDLSGDYWTVINQQSHDFFTQSNQLVLARGSLKPAAPHILSENSQLIDWGGGLRWTHIDDSDNIFCKEVRNKGGHIILYKGADRHASVFDTLPAPVMRIHKNLKRAFDPKEILNPGRMYKCI